LLKLTDQRDTVIYWLPALLAGLAAWVAFMSLGKTPLIRAMGLTLVIVGVSLTLRRLGTVYAIAGGLALAFSPAFWSQVGGGESAGPATIVLAVAAAGVVVVLLTWLAKRPYIGIGIGLAIFAVIFWSQIGTPRSLRLTSFLTAWLLYLLINMLRSTNPRPDDPLPGTLDYRYVWGLLLVITIGIINDPLFTLFVPAVVMGLLLSRVRLSWFPWIILGVVTVIGVVGIADQYVNSFWWHYPAQEAEAGGFRFPYMVADGWREPSRWIGLFGLLRDQFTLVGVLLGVLGLARLSRWYPPMGVVTMTAYSAYAVFGLVYFGQDRPVLLLPLLIVQIIWVTYAMYAFGQWLQKSAVFGTPVSRWLAPGLFALLPLWLFLQIVSTT
jgi:hypothetical protein